MIMPSRPKPSTPSRRAAKMLCTHAQGHADGAAAEQVAGIAQHPPQQRVLLPGVPQAPQVTHDSWRGDLAGPGALGQVPVHQAAACLHPGRPAAASPAGGGLFRRRPSFPARRPGCAGCTRLWPCGPACSSSTAIISLIDDGLVPAQVDQFVAERFQPQDGAAGDIVDVGEAARLGAVAGEAHRAALGDPLAEAEHDHIRPPGRAVDGEVAEDGHIDAKQVVVAVGQRLRRPSCWRRRAAAGGRFRRFRGWAGAGWRRTGWRWRPARTWGCRGGGTIPAG